jgi:hypothetical protein
MQYGLIGGFNGRGVGPMRSSVHLHITAISSIGFGGAEQVSSSLYSWDARFEPRPGETILIRFFV